MSGPLVRLLNKSSIHRPHSVFHRRMSSIAQSAEDDLAPKTAKIGRVFSGIQPTGAVHLGNYFGAIDNWVKLQEEVGQKDKLYFSAVDSHTMTASKEYQLEEAGSGIKKRTIKDDSIELTANLLACGIDPKKCVLFRQSQVPQHSELYWILGCLASTAILDGMHQFRDKSAGGNFKSQGLYTYPTLMAADILLYGTTHVPVGEDQRQHIRSARRLALNFNRYYMTDSMVVPWSMETSLARVMSLSDPTSKMSKSAPSPESRIESRDTKEMSRKKVRRAVTDSTMGVTLDRETRPGVYNLVRLLAHTTGRSDEEVAAELKDAGHAVLKSAVGDASEIKLAPIREKVEYYMANTKIVEEISNEGAREAEKEAHKRLEKIKSRIGLN